MREPQTLNGAKWSRDPPVGTDRELTAHGPQKPMENPFKGLTSAEAQRILGRVGPNATPDVAIHPLRLVLGKFLAPVSILLEIAIVLQLALGEYVEGSIIGVASRIQYGHWLLSREPGPIDDRGAEIAACAECIGSA